MIRSTKGPTMIETVSLLLWLFVAGAPVAFAIWVFRILVRIRRELAIVRSILERKEPD